MATIVNLDKVKASYGGNIESVKHTADLENGRFFMLGGLVTGERELREVVPINETSGTTSVSTSEIVVMHASPEVMYEADKSGLADFILPAGKAGRAIHFEVGDIITITEDAFTSAPTVGQYAVVAINGSMKLRPSTNKTALAGDGITSISPRLVFEVIESTTLGFSGTTAYALQVINA